MLEGGVLTEGASDLQVEPVSTPKAWNQVLRALPQPHVLQTWEWGAFKERHEWSADRWLWTAGGEPKAAATVLSRRIGPLPARAMYVPKGPILDYDDLALVARVLSDLEAAARSGQAVFVKIDPDVRADTTQGKAVVDLLQERGWRFSDEQVQFRNTLLLDLTRDLDEIMASMKSKWRYNIRLAGRRGVTVRHGRPEDLHLLYEMYEETSRRNQFVIRPESYYQDVWGSFLEAGLADPLIAEVEGEPVAMVVLFRFGERIWFMYGASRSIHRAHMPNHLLQWEAIRWGKEQGCRIYDMWGAPDELDESDPMWGVYRFKEGFGAQFTEHIGAYDYPTSELGYWLCTTVIPPLLALMRLRHWIERGVD
jgi:lipid II:glycine glycyltransferase (peptidoglycan interpeptide bridge formation enzyme)